MADAVSDDDDVQSTVPDESLNHYHPPPARHPPHPASAHDEEGEEGEE